MKINWKNKDYDLAEPSLCSLEDCLNHLESKVRIHAAIANAGDNDKATLGQLQCLLEKFLRAQFHQMGTGKWKWQPRNLTANLTGVYLVVYPDGGVKFGMSFNCQMRVQRQGCLYAAMVMKLQDMREIVSQELLSQVKKIGLPGLAFHDDQEGKLDDLITMQLCEMCLACTRECVTATVGERLVQLPNVRVCKAVAPHTFEQEVVDFMQGVPDKGVFCLLSWPTLASRLQRMAEESHFFAPTAPS